MARWHPKTVSVSHRARLCLVATWTRYPSHCLAASNLGALQPGEEIDVTRTDGTVAVFTISGVRQYPKDAFPTDTVYGNTTFAALRLITCGGAFDSATGHYLNNTVVFASLESSHPA